LCTELVYDIETQFFLSFPADGIVINRFLFPGSHRALSGTQRMVEKNCRIFPAERVLGSGSDSSFKKPFGREEALKGH